MTPTRPALIYPGGKWRIAPWVISHFPQHKVYVEPFGGGASVLLRKPPSQVEVYNDANKTVVDFFRILRDPEMAQELKRLLDLTPYSREEYARCLEKTDDPIESARRFVVLSFQSLGITLNRSKNETWDARIGDVTSRVASWNSYLEAFPLLVSRLRKVSIENRDWREIYSLYDASDTLFFMDPPYPHSTRKPDKLNTYAAYEMSDADHEELCQRCLEAKGYVILSSYPNDIYDGLLKGWEKVTSANRAQSHALRTEALYLSPRVSAERRGALGLDCSEKIDIFGELEDVT